MNTYKKIMHGVVKVENVVMAVTLLVSLFLTFANVVGRKFCMQGGRWTGRLKSGVRPAERYCQIGTEAAGKCFQPDLLHRSDMAGRDPYRCRVRAECTYLCIALARLDFLVICAGLRRISGTSFYRKYNGFLKC